MVTPSQYVYNGFYYGAEIYWGLSTDTKPVECGNGSVFVEMDTSLLYFYDAENAEWLEWGADAGLEKVVRQAFGAEKSEKTGVDSDGGEEEN